MTPDDRFLNSPHSSSHGWCYNATERMFDAWRRLYDRTLRLSLRFHAATNAVSIVLEDRYSFHPRWGAGVHFVIKPVQRMLVNFEYAQGVEENRGVYLKFGYGW